MSLINNNGVVLQGTGSVTNQVCGNMFTQDAVAVDVTSSSSSNVISQNIISLSSIGLRVETSGNTICENMITENQLGINIVNSNNNAIYHNNFIDNTIAFQLSSSTSPGNTWDNGYPSGGNYWSTWTGPDENSGPDQNVLGVSDGIVDTQYTVAVNNKDNYPLAKPFQLHNVGIATVALGKTVVGRGYCCNITLIIVDYGLYGETFNMAIWASQLRIDLQPVVLADRSSTEINFTWDTTGLLYGNYTVHSAADVVPDETLTADNNYIFNLPVHVGVPGDVSSAAPGVYDGVANMFDVAYMIALFNTRPNSPNWNPNADVNNDGVSNMKDIAIAIAYFNQRE
jgi:parallel beta-helix repeat protein